MSPFGIVNELILIFVPRWYARKYNAKEYLLVSIAGVLALLSSVWRYVAFTMFILSPFARFINYEGLHYLSIIIDLLLFYALYKIVFTKHPGYFEKENRLDDTFQKFMSSSGKYYLTVVKYKTTYPNWEVSLGEVYLTQNDSLLFTVYRNHGFFPFCFVEEHQNGHDYMICGQVCQGQTILELDTKRRVDFYPESAKTGHSFIWYEIFNSGDVLTVEGFYWNNPKEIWLIDFSEPMKLPYLVFNKYPGAIGHPNNDRATEDKYGIELTYTGHNKEFTKTLIWEKPSYIDTARDCIKRISELEKNSPYFQDENIQLKLILKKLTTDEKRTLKSEGLIP